MMKQAQIKVLNEELRQAGYLSLSKIVKRRVPKTAAVRAAERTLKKYDAAVRKEEKKMNKTYANLKTKARREIYFGTEKSALLAVRAVHKYQMDHS